ncbi:MAG: hypothetical protein U9N87_13610 [Planctomycetota bacterium]|nr:hypothetical protein [Planctomycetota bacterium]
MRFVLLLTILILSALPAAAAPELIVDIDFNDEVYIRPQPMTEAQVVDLVQKLHDGGTDTLLVRMGYLGYFPYRTKLSYPIGFDAEHARKHPYKRNLDPKKLEEFIKKFQAVHERYRKVMEMYNPPEVFIREGHKRGMKVVIWIDIFDDLYSGYRSKFIDENPHCQWTARDGKTYFKGLISYAWPEARAFRLAQVKELLDLGADGIHCSTSAHCRHLPNVQQDDFYGFEQPVVDEYKKLHGVDIRTAKDFDKEAWHKIKGQFMNRLYRELAAECHGRGKQFWVSLQLGEHTHMAADPYFGTNVVARYSNLWKELVDEKIADAFIVGDYELCSSPANAYWKAKKLVPPPQGDLFAWAAKQYQPYCRGKTKLYLFSEWLPGSKQALEHRMAAWAKRVVDNGFDGIDVHEAMNFGVEDGTLILKRLRDRLDGKKVGPLE